jgi:hypothetical protein
MIVAMAIVMPFVNLTHKPRPKNSLNMPIKIPYRTFHPPHRIHNERYELSHLSKYEFSFQQLELVGRMSHPQYIILAYRPDSAEVVRNEDCGDFEPM